MIENFTLMWIGTVAIIVTLFGVYTTEARNGESSLASLISFGIGLMFWALLTIHSTGYLQSMGQDALAQSTQSLTVVGIIGMVLTIALLFDAALRTIGDQT